MALSSVPSIPAQETPAQEIVSFWFPFEVGTRWTYDHEVRSGDAKRPNAVRWRTEEAVTGLITIPEGIVVLRRVTFKGEPDRDWLASYGESHYLLRGSCLYFLDPRDSWNEQARNLRPEFRKYLQSGRLAPNFCFPLQQGREWGNSSTEFSWRVERAEDNTEFPTFPTGELFDVVSKRFSSGDTMHIRFERRVGITGEWDSHSGTYFELRVRLVQFAAAPSAKQPPGSQ